MPRWPRPRATLLLAALAAAACARPESGASGKAADAPVAVVTRAPFGVLPGGDSVHVFTITNAHGVEVRALDYGGLIVSIRTADRTGHFDDIALGYDSLAGYLRDTPYFGALVGRYANRIAHATFTLDGTVYRLASEQRTQRPARWRARIRQGAVDRRTVHRRRSAGITLRYTSRDGEEGYPGTLSAVVTYTLDDQDRLSFDYAATTDRPTPVNLTQHTYFNLAGAGSGDVLGHVLTIDADRYSPVDTTLIPVGAPAPVAGTPFDFRTPTAIGARIGQADPQLRNGRGYDHNFVLNRSDTGLVHVIHVSEPKTGRTLDVATTEPGVQFYTGNFLDGTITGKGGHVYQQRYGFCLETQHFPDSPNRPVVPQHDPAAGGAVPFAHGLHLRGREVTAYRAPRCTLAWVAASIATALFAIGLPAQSSLPRAPGAHVVTIPGLGRFSEPSIAVNPRDPSQVVAVWQNQVHAAWSADSGRTFTPATGVQPPNYEVSGDVSVTFDDKGRAYLSYMGFDRAAPRTTLDRKLARQGLFVRRSDDGGRTWDAQPSTLIEFPTGNEPDIQAEDMPRIFADVSPGSPHAGNLYVGWIEWQPDKSVMLFSRSTDGARSWSRPVRISTHAGWPRDDNGALVGLVGTVGPDGSLWMAWNDGNTIAIVESRDGGRTFLPSRSVIDVGPPYFHNGVPGVSRVMGFPQVGIDPHGRPRGGRLYLCWSDYRLGDVDVFVASSTDLGRTWSAPVRVNDDRAPVGHRPVLPVDGRRSVERRRLRPVLRPARRPHQHPHDLHARPLHGSRRPLHQLRVDRRALHGRGRLPRRLHVACGQGRARVRHLGRATRRTGGRRSRRRLRGCGAAIQQPDGDPHRDRRLPEAALGMMAAPRRPPGSRQREREPRDRGRRESVHEPGPAHRDVRVDGLHGPGRGRTCCARGRHGR